MVGDWFFSTCKSLKDFRQKICCSKSTEIDCFNLYLKSIKWRFFVLSCRDGSEVRKSMYSPLWFDYVCVYMSSGFFNMTITNNIQKNKTEQNMHESMSAGLGNKKNSDCNRNISSVKKTETLPYCQRITLLETTKNITGTKIFLTNHVAAHQGWTAHFTSKAQHVWLS